MTAFAVTAMMAVGCSKSKSSSDSESSDYEYESSYSSSSSESDGSSDDDSYASNSDSYSSVDSDDDSDDDSDRSSVSSSNDEDWDDVLKSYEAFADKYISILKKASKGDVSALTEYAEYMDEAQSFANKLNSAKSDMTASQLAKFNKIQQKIVKAAGSFKVDPSKMEKAANKAMESVSSALSSFGGDDDDDDDDDDW